eukprot:TRINITY_DN5152_c0_g1_i1.p1 TRINITY_DN5152_c0_g1~~TRINITY_DN5152_c0_g1_i1.p1  ORF type:complete len:839 (+),score=305.09 TRINITY_DN5152_c0_g1_i1:123-2519(+)
MAGSKSKRAVALSPEEEQTKLLEEAKKKVNVEAFYMKRCLDNAKLMDALKHASNMIGQLRTGLFTPKNYYALYIFTFDQLRHLESYLFEENKKGGRMTKLYELVQYAGNILPRLYLIVTVGSVYIKSKEAPAKDVLKDLVEMCRGVQHPTRGLFLRNYLSEMTKDKLPDVGTEYEGVGGSAADSIEFILQNFTEMNKLWVRMQHQGPVKDRDRRESERQELRLLVGKNLARLSQLEGVTQEAYEEVVLPRVLGQIVNCKDQIAQQYLMECLIQVFPDEFHLRTLERLLSTCTMLQPGVNCKTIIVSLIDRLTSFAARSPELIPEDVPIFDVFFAQINKIFEKRKKMAIEDKMSVVVSLLGLSLKCYPSAFENVNRLLTSAAETLDGHVAAHGDITSPRAVKEIVRLLNIPLEAYKNILVVLDLEALPRLMQFLAYPTRKKVALVFVKNATGNSTAVTDNDHASKLWEFISPLLKDSQEGDVEDMDPLDLEDYEEEQCLVSSLVHLLSSESDEDLFAMYITARKFFGQGDAKSVRIKHLLPPLVFAAFKLADRIRQSEEDEWVRKAKKVFKFVHETISALAKHNLPTLALRLFLQAAQAADNCGFETIAYEFLTQSFVLYEDEISESKEQVRSIQLIVSCVRSLTCFGDENYDTLVTKSALHSSKLLRKPDQCRAVFNCSHLFWCGDGESAYHDGKRVLECLQKSLKIADSCMDAAVNVQLFVEILNQYLYFFTIKNQSITVKYIKGLVALINTNIANMESANGDDESAYCPLSPSLPHSIPHSLLGGGEVLLLLGEFA